MRVSSHTILLLFLIVICAVIYSLGYNVHASSGVSTWVHTIAREPFQAAIVDPAKVVVYQGNGVPDQPVVPTKFDQHQSFPTVDGTDGTPRSMFMMAFNKCDPSCCPSTYSCSGGCVCMTNEQKNFVGTRGSNNKGTKCSGGPSEF